MISSAGSTATPRASLSVSEEPGDPRFDRPLSGLYWQVTREPSGVVARSRSLVGFRAAAPQRRIVGGRAAPAPDCRSARNASLLAVERRVVLPARLGGGAVRVVVARDTADLAEATQQLHRRSRAVSRAHRPASHRRVRGAGRGRPRPAEGGAGAACRDPLRRGRAPGLGFSRRGAAARRRDRRAARCERQAGGGRARARRRPCPRAQDAAAGAGRRGRAPEGKRRSRNRE